MLIKPSQLAGERLPGLQPIAVPGFRYPIELTLHFAGDAGPDSGRVRLSCAGAVVLDDLAELPELAHSPWTDQRVVGVVDFPHLEVPPGSRRGVVPNDAAAALVQALLAIESNVTAALDERGRAEAASLSHDLHRQLAKLFTRVTSFVPHLEWFPVARRGGQVDEAQATGSGMPALSAKPADPEDEPEASEPELFPAGPLAAVELRPAKLELAIGEQRKLRARASDEHQRALLDGVDFEWASAEALALHAEGSRATATGLTASDEAWLEVVARTRDSERRCRIPVRVTAEPPRRADAGIPQPEEVNEPLQIWRSRLVDDKWQINVGHPDYRALAVEARPRLRYLAMLLSKEIVGRNFPQPGVGAILEELVGLLAALERSGAWTGREAR